jgi:flagellar protein FliS
MTPFAQNSRLAYANDAVLSASPVRLLTMLYDRLLLDLDRAERASVDEDWMTMSTELIHAQAIIAELTSSLRAELWDGGQSLLAIYHYTRSLLVEANIRREGRGIRESIEILDPIRLAWQEASLLIAAAPPLPSERLTTAVMPSRELGVA